MLKTAEILVSMSEGFAFGLPPQNNLCPPPLNLSKEAANIPLENDYNDGELHRRLKFKLHRTKPHETATSNLKHKGAGNEPGSRLAEVSIELSSICCIAL